MCIKHYSENTFIKIVGIGSYWLLYMYFSCLQCKPEYKVPGLYVIDSIVRQSRHQFGQEKDVYAPRFTKNIVVTFQNLFKCPTDERVRCWQILFCFFLNTLVTSLFLNLPPLANLIRKYSCLIYLFLNAQKQITMIQKYNHMRNFTCGLLTVEH